MLAAAERRPRDPQEGNVAKEFMNFFLFLCCFLLCGVDLLVVFFLSALVSLSFKSSVVCPSYQKTLKLPRQNFKKKRADTKNVAHVLCSSRESDGRRWQERQQQQRRRENNIAFNNNE